MFIIRLSNGEEVHANEGDELEINQQTGVLSVSRVDGFEEITTHYSPSAWLSVTHRKKGAGVRPSLVPFARWPTIDYTVNAQHFRTKLAAPMDRMNDRFRLR